LRACPGGRKEARFAFNYRTRKIGADRRLLAAARRNLATWIARYGDAAPRALGEWREILARPWPEIAALITDPRSPARSVRGRIERDFTPAGRRTSRSS